MLPLIGRADYVDERLSSKDRSRVAIHIYIPAQEQPEEIITRMTELLTSAGIEFALRCECINEMIGQTTGKSSTNLRESARNW